MTVPDMAVSDHFILAKRYVRVDAPADSEFAGFWCEVRQNLSNGERKLLIERLDELAERANERIEAARVEAVTINDQLTAGVPIPEQRELVKRLNAMTEQMNEVAEQSRVDRWALVAPHIHDWNAYTSDGDEAPVKVEPPDVGGVASLGEITSPMADWISTVVLQAYRSGKGVTNRSTPPGGSGQPGGGPKVANGKAKSARIRPSQTSSPGPSASAFQA